ncbi:putative splicing factor 3B subunit 3 [Meira miltonrushii]|uniref:Putative splicing factor 3B subunit 3 n=1 Tax=Meira miltonrushii TaxID=1280837 RepID=A0A316VHM2_9BASI|nr:putative splicing factor 3B subunit 3 [Meira miltonrushii]PWN37092.1 putative splicing factor 3B subunit 3 [Meira miltonrushii]
MHLYNITLVPPSNITAAVVGQFSGTRQQEIVVCKAGTRLELIRPDTNTGKQYTVLEQDAFGTVRSLASFRLTGGTQDYLIIGSDSGRITIAEYVVKQNAFRVVHQETFGRSGARRVVAGQYLATDPKGRATMIGAVEKSKLVYILNRDAEANLTISSPLEAHRPNAIIHAIVGVDVGYENPLFATLEVDYDEADRDPSGEAFERTEKLLTYYELDLGLNHVVRRWSSPVDMLSNHLVQVPGGYNQNTERWEGPSGVLVCSEDYITYKHNVGEDHRIPIPRRLNPVERASERRGNIIVASVCHRMKTAFFFLLQNENGDLFKVTIDHEGEEMQSLKIKYFDTVPLATNLCILRAGFLYVAAESGNSSLYSFQKLGDDDDFPEYASSDYPRLGMTETPPACPTFTPRPLENLLLTDENDALDPLLDAKLLNPLASDTPQIFTASGRGPRSHLKMLQHGLDVQEAVSSELPGVPKSVWTTKLRANDEHDSYIILSFVNGTLVLSIGESIEEVSDSGLLTSAPTLAVQQLGDDALLQVHPDGIRHILADKQVTEWTAPETSNGEQSRIVQAATNSRQVVVALEPSNELVYFELDMDGQLNEYQDRKAVGSSVLTMSLGEVPEGRQRTPYLAVGCQDQTVRIISLDPDNTLASVSIQALTAPPNSICVAEMNDMSIDPNHPTMFVNIGLTNGVLLRTVLDPISGQLTDTRLRFLGAKPVRLIRVRMQGNETAVLALSTRSWLSYTFQQRTHFTPLLFDSLDHAWTFSAELCPEGLIGISAGNLRIFTIPVLGQKFKTDKFALTNTPRRIASHPDDVNLVFIAGADHRVMSEWEKEKRLAELGRDLKPKDQGVLNLSPAEFGPVRAEAGNWSSSVQIVDIRQADKPIHTLQLENNEAATCLCLASFANDPLAQNGSAMTNGNGAAMNGYHESSPYLIIGSSVGATVRPRSSTKNYLSVYALESEGKSLTLIHKTEVDDIPSVVQPFGGRLVAGIGKALRVYDMGRKKLLRKCENKSFPTNITAISTQAGRIVVGDVQESTFFVTYKPIENRLLIFADDTLPRWTTALAMLDYDTVCAGDKFGNIFVNRIDGEVSKSVDEDTTGLTVMHEKPYLQGAPHKLTLEAHFHLGDIVISIHKTSLVAGGRPVIIYTCLGGTVGCLVPFSSKEDMEMMTSLEILMRKEQILNLLGREHMSFRGSYTPVKSVIDGDLCELFATLPLVRQRAIAEEFERTPAEMNKKLESIRTTSAF